MAPHAPATDLPPDQAKLAEQATDLDNELAELRARFDQYFLGIERKNPAKDLEDYRKRLLKLKGDFLRNTALKFRVQNLYHKFQAFERLWVKSLKEMEDGTYARDLARLRRKNQRRGAEQKDKPKDVKAQGADEKEKPERPDSYSLDESLEADLPAELFEDQPPKLAAKPLPRQKTDPALPSEMGGPPSAPPRAAPAPAPRQPTNPPPPLPLPRQPSAGQPLPRQPSNPPPPPVGSVKPLPRQATLPPPPPAGAFGTPVSLPRQPSNPPAAAARASSQPLPRQPSNPPPRPGGGSVAVGDSGLSTDKVQRIYDAYITAKKRCKESTDGITLDAVAQSLRKQVPTLMKEHGAKSVDFKVVIKDGKAVLKAVPK